MTAVRKMTDGRSGNFFLRSEDNRCVNIREKSPPLVEQNLTLNE